MVTPVKVDALDRVEKWMIGGLNGWSNLFDQLFPPGFQLDPASVEQLERASDRIAGFVREKKAVAGMDQNSKTY